jgi:hypothetical protein
MDVDEVEKRKLLYEIEDKLWHLLKRRAWIIALIGVGGIWGLVHFTVKQLADRPLQDFQRQLVQAEILADRAKGAAAAASSAADQVTAQLASLTAVIQGLKDQAQSIQDQFGLVRDRITAEAKNAALRSEKDFSAVQQRIAALEALVKKIGEENEATRKATAEYATKIVALESQIENEPKRFAEHSSYTVWISFFPDRKSLAQQVQSRLAGAGFKAPISEIPTSIKLFPDVGKGISLSYVPQTEGKAQEVAALISPIVKDIKIRKIPEKPPDVFFKKIPWEYVEPTSMFLMLGE